MVSDEELEAIQEQIGRYRNPGPDDETAGYVQGLEDAVRILQGLLPKYRRW